MITEYGMSATLGDANLFSNYDLLSPSTKTAIETEIRDTLASARSRGTAILTTHRNELENIARALIEYETLTRDDMIKVMRGEKLPKITPAGGGGGGGRIKVPEIVLPPGIAGVGGAVVGAGAGAGGGGGAQEGGSSGGGNTSKGRGRGPPESGEGDVKV